MGNPATSLKQFDRKTTQAAALIVITLLAYFPVFRGGFIFDDNVFLTENPLIAASDGLRRFWFSREALDYWPVTSSTLWLEWRVWGTNAAGYHATNLALHIGEVLLLWALLRRLKIPGAFFGALLFAVHPLNAESVAWITQRKNLMGLLFFLLSLHGFLSGRRPGYWLAVICFALAMLSKGSTVILPVVLLGIVLWQRRPTTEDILRLAPFFVVAVGLAGFEATFSTLDEPIATQPAQLVVRGLRASAVIWFYFAKAIWPTNLSFDYGLWKIDPLDARWWLPLVAALALTWGLWRFRRSGSRAALFAWGYFCIALLPVMGFAEVGFMRYSPVSNHYAHLALIGLAALAGAGLARGEERLARAEPPWKIPRAAFWGAGMILGGMLGVLTWRQCTIYADGERLYRDTLARNPSSALAHTNLGVILTLSGRFDEALGELQAAVKLTPASAKAHDDLGVALYRLGRIAEAIREYREAVRLEPEFFEAHNNLGAAFARAGRLPEAITEFQESLRLNPDYTNARTNLERAEKLAR